MPDEYLYGVQKMTKLLNLIGNCKKAIRLCKSMYFHTFVSSLCNMDRSDRKKIMRDYINKNLWEYLPTDSAYEYLRSACELIRVVYFG